MESESADSALSSQKKTSEVQPSATVIHGQDNPENCSPAAAASAPASGLSSPAEGVKVSQPSGAVQGESQLGNDARSTFARLTSGLGFRFPSAAPAPDATPETTEQGGVLGIFTKGVVGSSRNAVKAVTVKARHLVSQNKRRYQEGEFDLDMTYITDNIIAMGFPAGDISSGIFGYIEGFYRNHMEEVIKFFETCHQGKYKVYNLCSERLYDASLFQGKAASFPFDDHNCPPIHLILSFCQSAYTWLKEDIDNVVVVHCKAGLGRTGLMISSLLLYLKFYPNAEESIDCFNQKRCVDGKGLVLPSQIRYVKYFEHILNNYHGNNPPARRCMLRGFRLHKCPYWIRPSITIYNHNGILFSTKKHPKTKDLMPEDFWISSSKKGIAVFAVPGEPGLAEVTGDFKIHFHDSHGDFYCWLNTTLMENRIIINSDDLDGFDKRKLPSPTFQLEIVVIDYDGMVPKRSNIEKSQTGSVESSAPGNNGITVKQNRTESSKNEEKDDIFSDSDGEEGKSSRATHVQASGVGAANNNVTDLTQRTQQMSIEPTQTKSTSHVVDEPSKSGVPTETPKLGSSTPTDFKAIAADASVFSFGDDEDYESE